MTQIIDITSQVHLKINCIYMAIVKNSNKNFIYYCYHIYTFNSYTGQSTIR